MKKNYIVPSMMMVFVETQSIMTGSPTLNSGKTVPNAEVNHTEYDGQFSSRRHDIWEDEEEY